MNILKIIVAVAGIICTTATASAKIHHPKKVSVKVLGNCEMCKQRIEKTATVKNQVSAQWDEKTHLAILTFDSLSTTQEAILKRIAYAGHDNEVFIAPDAAYDQLPACCKYPREFMKPENKSAEKEKSPGNMEMNTSVDSGIVTEQPQIISEEIKDMADQDTPKADTITTMETANLSSVYNDWLSAYFAIKNAFTADNAAAASSGASKFIELSASMPMDKMSADQHMAWMKVIDKLKTDALLIYQTKELSKQRNAFQSLSKNVSTIVKVFMLNNKTVYRQFCPMFNNSKGAYWISEQSAIKNPYYGKSMPTCGSTTEVIKSKK